MKKILFWAILAVVVAAIAGGIWYAVNRSIGKKAVYDLRT